MEGRGLSFQSDVMFWVNTKHFLLFFQKKKQQQHIQLWVEASHNLPTILFWLLHWKKLINHSEVCCCTPLDEWPFVFALLWVKREERQCISLPYPFFVCLFCEHIVIDTCQNQHHAIAVSCCLLCYLTSCPSVPYSTETNKGNVCSMYLQL